MSEEVPGMIYEAMTSILKDVDAVSKDRTSVGKFQFKYRGIDDCMNALHTAFGEHGVFLSQRVIEHKMDFIEGRGIHHIATVEFSFIAKDGSRITSEVMGECIENGDKGIGKCMSYALKTCLLQTFLIPTEDETKDPDATNQPITPPIKNEDTFFAAKRAMIDKIGASQLPNKAAMIAKCAECRNPKELSDLDTFIRAYVAKQRTDGQS